MLILQNTVKVRIKNPPSNARPETIGIFDRKEVESAERRVAENTDCYGMKEVAFNKSKELSFYMHPPRVCFGSLREVAVKDTFYTAKPAVEKKQS